MEVSMRNKRSNTVQPVVLEEPKKDEPKEAVGEVVNVDRALNIRSAPEVRPNNQIAIWGKGSKLVVVDPDHPIKDKSNCEWYKVRLHEDADISDPEQNGYAMKKYIKVL